MVATLVRLRLTLLRRTLARETWRVVVLLLGLVWAMVMAPTVVGGMLWVGMQPVEVAHDVLVVAGSLLVVGWLLVPLLVPGMDDSLDVSRFATFGVPARRIVPGLLVAALVGVPTLATGAVAAAPVIAWAQHGAEPAAVALPAALLGLALCVLGARISTALGGLLLGSRRSREIGLALGTLVVLVAVPGVLAIGSMGLEGALERVPGLAAVLGWTPLGLTWAAPAAMADGDLVGSVARLGLAALWVALAAACWTRLLDRALVRPPSRSTAARRRADGMLAPGWIPFVTRPRAGGAAQDLGWVAATAVARRGLRYWSADPRYVSSLLGSVVAPVVIVLLVATVVDAPAAVALSMGPLMAGSIGWSRHNDVAFDGTAFWMHVAARVPGWVDRWGRTAATAVWAVPLSVLASVAGAWVAGRPDLTAAAIGTALGALCAGLAVSAVVSTLLPYPVPEPGASPYAAQMGALGASMVAQVLSSAATFVLCVPVLIGFGLSLWSDPVWSLPTLVVGVIGGPAVLAGGVVLGGRIHEARAVRALARMS